MDQYLGPLKELFAKNCPDEVDQLLPCSEAEVVELEERLGVHFPQAYYEFLLWMGHNSSSVLERMLGYRVMFTTKSFERRFVAEKAPKVKLPEDALAIAFDPSQMLWFIRPGEGDNPKVYVVIPEDNRQAYKWEKTINDVSPEWAFLFEDQKDYYTFSQSFTDFINYELAAHFQFKHMREAGSDTAQS